MSNDELQKAIDDITSGDNSAVTSASIPDDTATVSLPEGMGDSQLKYEEASIPALDDMKAPEMESSAVAVTPVSEGALDDLGEKEVSDQAMETPSVSATADAMTLDLPEVPNLSETKVEEAKMTEAPSEIPTELPAEQPRTEIKMPELSENGPSDPQLKEVETAALIELYPLLSKMNVNAREKFDICMKVIDKTGERGATSAALDAAKAISDENERGECLVKLVEAIDKME